MAKTAMIRARMEPALKEEVEQIFDALGLSMTDALTLFFKQVQIQRRIPFDLTVDVADQPIQLREQEAGYHVPPASFTARQENRMLTLREKALLSWLEAEYERQQAQIADPYARIREIVADSPLLRDVDLAELISPDEARAYFADEHWFAGAWADMTPEHWQLFERESGDSTRQQQLDALFEIE